MGQNCCVIIPSCGIITTQVIVYYIIICDKTNISFPLAITICGVFVEVGTMIAIVIIVRLKNQNQEKQNEYLQNNCEWY